MKAELNGAAIDLDDRLVPLSLYGTGVYSSFTVKDGGVRGWSKHLDRLTHDASGFLGLQVEKQDIARAVLRFLKSQEDAGSAIVRVTVFPGDFDLGAPHRAGAPQLLVTGRKSSSIPPNPLALKTIDLTRAHAEYKTVSLGSALKARALAKHEAYDDALFVDQGVITEGPTWNVFLIIGDRPFTPRLTGKLLPGVSRALIIEGMKDEVVEQDIALADLGGFEAGFVTSAAIGPVPIGSIDGRPLNAEHPIISAAQKTYERTPWETIEG